MNKQQLPILISLSAIAILLVAIVLTSLYTRSNQDVRTEANVDEVSLIVRPESATLSAGQTQTISIDMDFPPTYQEPISAVSFRLIIPKTNGSLNPSNIAINHTLSKEHLWNFPISKISQDAQNFYVEVAGVIVSPNGFKPTTTNLASFQLKAMAPSSPITVQFDQTESSVIEKVSNTNVLQATNQATFKVDGSTPLPTPEIGTPTPSPSPTVTPGTPSPNPSPSPTVTPGTPSPSPTVTPDTQTPTPAPVTHQVQVRFRVQGITSQRQTALKTQVRFELSNGNVLPVTVNAFNDANSFYTTQTYQLPALPQNILVKSRSHLQKRFNNVEPKNINGVYVIDISDQELIAADVNDSNTLTITDLTAILRLYTAFSVPVTQGTPEDVNDDQRITIDDLAVSVYNYDDFTVYGDN